MMGRRDVACNVSGDSISDVGVMPGAYPYESRSLFVRIPGDDHCHS